MNLNAIHDLTAELVVNRELWRQFLNNPQQVCSEYGLETEEADYLQGLKPAHIETFRGVIEGTREVHFTQVFHEAAALIGEKSWLDLIRRFHEDSVIRSNENGADLIQFALYCDSDTALSAWIWHAVLRVSQTTTLGRITSPRLRRVGQNALLARFRADVSGEVAPAGESLHYFLYVFSEESAENMSLLEIDAESGEKLISSTPLEHEMRESLSECGVIL